MTTLKCVTGVGRGLSGSCKGDSGGPLMLFDPSLKGWLQVGMVQGGTGRCGSLPGIYVRLEDEEILEFIKFGKLILDWIICIS